MEEEVEVVEVAIWRRLWHWPVQEVLVVAEVEAEVAVVVVVVGARAARHRVCGRCRRCWRCAVHRPSSGRPSTTNPQEGEEEAPAPNPHAPR